MNIHRSLHLAMCAAFAAVALALSLCTGCIGEGEQEFRPTPGVININY